MKGEEGNRQRNEDDKGAGTKGRRDEGTTGQSSEGTKKATTETNIGSASVPPLEVHFGRLGCVRTYLVHSGPGAVQSNGR